MYRVALPPSKSEKYVLYKKEPLPQEKHTNKELYRRQVETLKLFLGQHRTTGRQKEKIPG